MREFSTDTVSEAEILAEEFSVATKDMITVSTPIPATESGSSRVPVSVDIGIITPTAVIVMETAPTTTTEQLTATDEFADAVNECMVNVHGATVTESDDETF